VLRSADPTNPTVLTIGFARRFATYKRAALLFNNLDWLREILSDAQRPVLFIFAGKAHPADEPGRQLIRRSPNFPSSASSRAASCWSKATTCTWHDAWWPASMSGSTIRSIRWKLRALRA
jgi:hypothetical protein